MKAKFSRAIECYEKGEVNFALGNLDHSLEKTKTKELLGARLDSGRDMIISNIDVLISALGVLKIEVEHDHANLRDLQIEQENEPRGE